ncbi:MAG: right-handed parallel beta-helix repeat-containing protein, partial [Tepidisphaeraceae bacterium]
MREAVCQPLEGRLLLSKTIYVDVNSPAPATNGPTWGTAYKDLQLALAVAVSGDTIKVGQGTYKPTSGTNRAISFQLKTGVAIYGGYAGYGSPHPDTRSVMAYPTILSGDIGTIGNTADNSYHVVAAGGLSNTAVLDGFTITGGNASDFGGGLYNNSGSPTISNCTLIGNSASMCGGGMYNVYSSPTLTNCTFIANSATSYGGGMYNSTSSNPTLANCVFNGNSVTGASGYGGGISDTSSSKPTLTNCTFVGNAATGTSGYGGGMNNDSSSSPTLTNCTFAGNVASSGGALYNSAAATLTNCIVWGNTPSSSQIYGSATVTYGDPQQSGGVYVGAGNINSDPLFVRNPSPGPDGKWGTADDDYGDLRLCLSSPAIDAGKNAAVPAGVTTDLAGNTRFADVPAKADTGVGTAPIVDMGAYEAIWSTVVYVDPSTAGVEDGTTWATAYRSLAAAMAMVISGQQIHVADGTYSPTPTTDRTISFQLKSGVQVFGGYAGYGAANPDARNVVGTPSVLSGDISTVGSNTDNSYHVIVGSGTDSTAVLDGFTITGGNANGTSPNNVGGGIYNSASSPTIRNCAFSGNTAGTSGGGMYNTSASPSLVNCVFTGDSAGTGPGVYNDSASSPTLVNCTVAENSGVGVYSSSASPTIRNCIIWSPSGTAITQSGGTATVSYSLIKGGYTGTGNLNVDPQFVRNPSSTDNGDLRLRLSSPAIDAAKNADVPTGTTTDLAGVARFKDVPS